MHLEMLSLENSSNFKGIYGVSPTQILKNSKGGGKGRFEVKETKKG